MVRRILSIRRHRGLADILLFLRALPLARLAQQIHGTPLPDIITALKLARRSISPADPTRAVIAAARASRRWAQWSGGIDTCLTRSLVCAGLLASHPRPVVIHLGIRPGQEETSLHGHAWVSLDGWPVGSDGLHADGRYERVLDLPVNEGRPR